VTPRPASLSASSPCFRIGIDLGGTKIEGVVLDPSGEVRLKKRIDTEREGGYEHIVSRVQGLYRELAAAAGGPASFGIGTPGAVSARTGTMKNSNTTCLNGRPLHQDLERAVGRPLRIENDANCFALAEGTLGAGKGLRMVFGVIMGTGCGGGLMIDGHVWTGPQSIGGEWGHMSIDPKGPACYCGSRGCVETFISGGGLESLYMTETGSRKSAVEIVDAYRAGEPAARARMEDFFDRFGRSVANLISVLDPDMVVLGGGLSSVPELYTTGRDAVRKYVFSDSLETPIMRNRLGDSAGVLGAALVGI
jgi:fructokinase